MSNRRYFSHKSWWGKIIGAFLGYLIGGPSGALLGLVIGNLFDRGLITHFDRPYWEYHSERTAETQAIFFEATFSVMGYLAKMDGRVSENELEAARQIMDEMRLSMRKKQEAKRFFNSGKENNFNLDRILLLLKKSAYNNPGLLRLFCDFLYRMAKTDGLTESKRQPLNRILQYLGFAPLHRQYHTYEDLFNEQYREYRKRQYQYQKGSSQSSNSSNSHSGSGYQYQTSNLSHAYALLGVSSTANKNEVKRAYRRLISKNHPDRLIAKGVSEAEIKKATDITQKISKAYEQICESRGW